MVKIKPYLFALLDLILVALSYLLAVWIRMDLSFANLTYYNAFVDRIWIIVIVYFVVFKLIGIDKSIPSGASVSEAVRVLFACLIGSIITFVIFTTFEFLPVPRSIYLIQAVLMVLILEFVRFSFRIYLMLQNKAQSYSASYERTLIVGAGAAGIMLLKEITANKMFKNRVIGFVDDNKEKTRKSINGVNILGTTDDLSIVVNTHQIEIIYLAMPSVQLAEQKRVIEKCYETGCKVKVLTSTQDMISSNGIKRSLREIGIEDLLGRQSIQLDNAEIRDFIYGKVVLVSGAAGSIGSELCQQIIQHEPKLLILMDINENGLYDLQQEFNMRRTEGLIKDHVSYIPIITSIRDLKAVDRLFAKYLPELVFHAAAHKHVPLMEEMPMEAVKNNIFGSNNLINTSIKYKVQRFVSISTDKAVNPTNVMGATKRFIEKIIQSMDNDTTKFVAVRFGNVLGSNGSIIPLFKKQIENGGPLTITDRRIIRYFMTIPEAVSLVLQAATFGKGGEIFVLDMGKPVKIIDLAEKMIRLAGYIPYQDIKINEIGLRPGEKLYEELLFDKENVTTTSNQLIFVAHPMKISHDVVLTQLCSLEELIMSDDTTDEEIVEALTKIVENYIPNRNGGDSDVQILEASD